MPSPGITNQPAPGMYQQQQTQGMRPTTVSSLYTHTPVLQIEWVMENIFHISETKHMLWP